MFNINNEKVRTPLLAQLEANNYSQASQEVAEFVLSNIVVGNLSTDLRVMLMQLAAVNISNASIICEYLQEYDFSEKSIEAVENALSDISNNIYPTTILNLVTKQWQKDLINNVLSLSTPFINTIQQTFNTNQNVNLSFINKNFPDANAGTSFPTSSEISSGNFTIYITYDNSYLDTATNLSLVAVTVHEMVHAHLRNLYINGQLPSVDASYNNLFNAYIGFYKNSNQVTFNQLDNLEHNAIMDFMNKMADVIYSYAQSKNINVTWDYCKTLAWGTNTGYSAFNLLTPTQQQQSNDAYYYEQEGIPPAKGTRSN